MPRLVRKLILTLKPETTYGVDSVPTGAANAIVGINVVFTPMNGGEERRELVLPYFANQGVILTGEHAMIEFSAEIAGAGAAGSVPAYGAALRACRFAETINAGVSVVYAPVSDAMEAATIHYNLDGVRHAMVGCRGTVSWELAAQRIPRMRFRMWGLTGTISDVAMPTPTFTHIKPVIVSKSNTTFGLHGYTGPMEQFSLDIANTVEPRLLVNEESILITDSQPAGSVTLAAEPIATKNWFAAATARTRGTLACTHGVTAGNIVQFGSPAVEVGRPTQGAANGVANYQMGLMLCPLNGNDEMTITVR